MIAKWTLWAALVIVVGLRAQAEKAESFIRVRLMQADSALQISGSSISIQGKGQKFLPVSLAGVSSLKIRYDKSVGDSWLVQADASKEQRYLGNPLAVQGEFLRVGGQLAPSRLLLFADHVKLYPVIDVVAVIDIENYLLGVLAGEMPASWPMEALKAQAVASRSYALFHRMGRDSRQYHVDSTIKDQVFDFQGSRRLSEEYKTKIRRAVGETRGQVLFDKKGALLEAFYHADCGGRTEITSEVWGGRQALTSVKDPYCAGSPYTRWASRWSLSSLNEKLTSLLLGQTLIGLEVGQVNDSGRVRNLVGTVVGRKKLSLNATEVRRLLGTTRLKSTRFVLRNHNSVVEFVGKGYGHGVGLCQWGAKSMAGQGKNYQQILAHYYRGFHLRDVALPQPLLSLRDLSSPDGDHHFRGEEKKSAKADYVEQI